MAGKPKTKAALTALEKLGIETIAAKIADGATTAAIAKAAGVSRPVLSAFLNRAENADAYARARETRAARHAERIEELADMVEQGEIDTNAARVSIDARKWIAARMDARNWGEQKGATVNINLGSLHSDSLRKAPAQLIEVIDESA